MTALTSMTDQKIRISIKTRNEDGAWLSVSGIGGLTLRQICQKMEGTAAVGECRIGEKLYYFCGTDLWKRKMKKKGATCTFQEAVSLLDVVCPSMLDGIPVPIDVDTVFPGVQLSVFENY